MKDGSQGSSISEGKRAYDQVRSLMTEGKFAESVAILEKALEGSPDSAELHFGMGTVLMRLRQVEPAVKAFQEAVRLSPTFVEAYGNLGALQLQIGCTDEAMAAFERCISLNPEGPAGYLNLALTYKANGDLERATDFGVRAMQLAPGWAEAYYNLGNILLTAGRLQEAVALYRQAIERRPKWAEAHNSLGTALMEQNRLAEAISAFERALQVEKDWYLPTFNLAVALRKLGRDSEAINGFRRTIACRPDLWDAHVELGLLLIKHGYLPEGWREYEWRWQSSGHPAKRVTRPQPIWGGERFEGRTLLLCAEQGYGDMIQFARFVASIKPLGGSVFLECPARLKRLLATCPGIDRLISSEQECEEADYQLPLMSVPHILCTTLETIPKNTPYLFASPSPQIDRTFDSHKNRFKVGISWTGSPKHPLNAARSCSPADFAVLSRLPGVSLFSLQMGTQEHAGHELDELQITSLEALQQDFADTASIMLGLDLVITIDTALAHLAGALGRPVWLLLHDQADSRWMVERNDSPWYPTMRLFRQTRPGNWAGVFTDVAVTLREILT